MFALKIVVQTWPFKREINKLFCDRYGGFYWADVEVALWIRYLNVVGIERVVNSLFNAPSHDELLLYQHPVGDKEQGYSQPVHSNMSDIFKRNGHVRMCNDDVWW